LGRFGGSRVFDIVDLERETQAAVFLRWLETITMTLTFAVFFEDTMPFALRSEWSGSRQEYVELMPVRPFGRPKL
jgi:hypothetical protein